MAVRTAGSGAVIDMAKIRLQLAESDRAIALGRASRKAGAVQLASYDTERPADGWAGYTAEQKQRIVAAGYDPEIMAATRRARNVSEYKAAKAAAKGGAS